VAANSTSSIRRAIVSIVSANSVTASKAPSSPHPDTRDRLAVDGETDRRRGQQRDRLDHHLGLRARMRPIVDPQRVGALVDQRSQPRVGRRVGVDDDPPVPRIAPAARRPVDRLERHGEPERLGERLHRLDQVRMRVPGQRFARRLEQHRLDPGQRLGLRQGEHERGLEEHAPLAGLLPALVALLDRDRGEDPQRLLVLADRPAEPQPGAKPGDALGHHPALVALQRDQHAVARRIRVEHRSHPHPASPALRGQQRLRSALQPLAILTAALGALVLGQPAR
jgi:hypothetical protein